MRRSTTRTIHVSFTGSFKRNCSSKVSSISCQLCSCARCTLNFHVIFSGFKKFKLFLTRKVCNHYHFAKDVTFVLFTFSSWINVTVTGSICLHEDEESQFTKTFQFIPTPVQLRAISPDLVKTIGSLDSKDLILVALLGRFGI